MPQKKKVDPIPSTVMKKNRQPLSAPLSEVEAARRGIKVDRDGLVRCRVCGCTERQACFPPCGWVPKEADICDRCHTAATILLDWHQGAWRPSKAALWREVARMRARPQRGAA